jgi:soluble lytic murein transglycosylase-like protein
MKICFTFRRALQAMTPVLVGSVAAVCLSPAYAAQRVVLRNGSSVICDHQQDLNGQIRLFFTASSAEYMDISPEQVLRTETIAAETAQPTTQPLPQNTRTAADVNDLLNRAGEQHHIDPDLLASVVRAESGGRTKAISHAGARGLMQLMPGTASELGVRDSFAPDQNIAGGTTYLDALLTYYHDNVALALAAYNAGPAAVNRYGGIPPYTETRRYIERVIHEYNRRKLQEIVSTRQIRAGHASRRTAEISSISSPAGAASGQ